MPARQPPPLLPPGGAAAESDPPANDAARDSRTWNAFDFSPFPDDEHTEFFAEGGATYRRLKDRVVEVCGFVPEPLGETICVGDLDRPEASTTRTLSLRITAADGEHEVEVPVDGGAALSRAIVAAVPSSLGRLSVKRPGDVAAAAAALASPSFFSRTTFAQTGWMNDGSFALPGAEHVDLRSLGGVQGVRLLKLPSRVDVDAAELATDLLARLCSCAPATVTVPILGTIAASPIHRRSDHLGARGFVTLLAGVSMAGKTTLVRRMYSLLGDFLEQPGAITTWNATAASLEPTLHALRDLPVFIDNFRVVEAREQFRRVALGLGDGAARDRGAWTGSAIKVAAGLPPKALVIATGEQAPEDDAAISARILQLDAVDIDRKSLWEIEATSLRTLPHLFGAYLLYVSALPPEWWSHRRQEMKDLAAALPHAGEARTAENIATMTAGFATFAEFVRRTFPSAERRWRTLTESFADKLEEFALQQARRVIDERLDAVVLREVARGLRERQVRLERLRGRSQSDAPGRLLGAYDHTAIYLIPDVLTRWANDQLRAAGRRREPIGRKELGTALKGRGGPDGERMQRSIAGRVHGVWVVRRDGLGDDWAGLP